MHISIIYILAADIRSATNFRSKNQPCLQRNIAILSKIQYIAAKEQELHTMPTKRPKKKNMLPRGSLENLRSRIQQTDSPDKCQGLNTHMLFKERTHVRVAKTRESKNTSQRYTFLKSISQCRPRRWHPLQASTDVDLAGAHHRV